MSVSQLQSCTSKEENKAWLQTNKEILAAQALRGTPELQCDLCALRVTVTSSAFDVEVDGHRVLGVKLGRDVSATKDSVMQEQLTQV